MTTIDDAGKARVEAELERFIREIGKVETADTAFGRTAELFDSGYLDSLGIVALTTHIAQTFGVTFDEEQLFDPRFTTIAGIAEVVAASPHYLATEPLTVEPSALPPPRVPPGDDRPTVTRSST